MSTIIRCLLKIVCEFLRWFLLYTQILVATLFSQIRYIPKPLKNGIIVSFFFSFSCIPSFYKMGNEAFILYSSLWRSILRVHKWVGLSRFLESSSSMTSLQSRWVFHFDWLKYKDPVCSGLKYFSPRSRFKNKMIKRISSIWVKKLL